MFFGRAGGRVRGAQPRKQDANGADGAAARHPAGGDDTLAAGIGAFIFSTSASTIA